MVRLSSSLRSLFVSLLVQKALRLTRLTFRLRRHRGNKQTYFSRPCPSCVEAPKMHLCLSHPYMGSSTLETLKSRLQMVDREGYSVRLLLPEPMRAVCPHCSHVT